MAACGSTYSKRRPKAMADMAVAPSRYLVMSLLLWSPLDGVTAIVGPMA
jgi:hypothetical protein